MFTQISQMEPLFPAHSGALEDLARAVVAASARLEGRLAPLALTELRTLLRTVNSYYSNLIEGHKTRLVDIERAMRDDYVAEPEQRDLQIESRIHIEVQQKLEQRLTASPAANVCEAEFLCWLHHEFYAALPERLRWLAGANDEREWVEAGQFRTRMVEVGRHVPPSPTALPDFLRRFASAYDPAPMHGLHPLLALSAAHHRLAWIHPFTDGNGRIARLFTDAYFQRIGLAGYGLWNVSRGLARRRDEYRQQLAAADAARAGALDGRGNLSERALTEFCRFFLEVCLDQANYMNDVLALPGWFDRLEHYVALRKAGMVPNAIGDALGKAAPPLHPRTAALLRALAIEGELTRGAASRVIGMSERTGRNVLKGLLAENLIKSTSEKSPVRLSFPAHAAGYWFPDL